MKITLSKDIPARKIRLSTIAAGSVLDIDEHTAIFLEGRGFAEFTEPVTKTPSSVVEPVAEETAQPDTETEKKPRKARN